MLRVLRTRIGGLALLALLAAGCGSSPGSTSRRPDLILISLDTLRADRLGAYGYARDTSPALDALAAQGTLFEHAVAESSWTLPSHATLLTGLYPSTHGVVQPQLRLADDLPTLAQLLRSAGYRTIGLTDGIYLTEQHGFARGFERFDAREKGLSSSLELAREAIAELPDDAPFFLFVHTYDIHCPYAPAPAFEKTFESPGARPIETMGRCGNPHFNRYYLREGEVLYLSDRYDDSIRQADAALADFFGWLERRGLLERSLIVVTSDHGEEFYEHGRIGHERTLHREALMVPLILRLPGAAPRRVSEPVGLVDLAPTLLDLLELPVPAAMEGRSLAGLVRGDAPEASAATARVSELDYRTRLRSVMTPEWHLILDDQAGAELYRVELDRREVNDVAASEPAAVADLRKLLAAYEADRRPHEAARRGELDAEERARLRALGYLDATSEENAQESR